MIGVILDYKSEDNAEETGWLRHTQADIDELNVVRTVPEVLLFGFTQNEVYSNGCKMLVYHGQCWDKRQVPAAMHWSEVNCHHGPNHWQALGWGSMDCAL